LRSIEDEDAEDPDALDRDGRRRIEMVIGRRVKIPIAAPRPRALREGVACVRSGDAPDG